MKSSSLKINFVKKAYIPLSDNEEVFPWIEEAGTISFDGYTLSLQGSQFNHNYWIDGAIIRFILGGFLYKTFVRPMFTKPRDKRIRRRKVLRVVRAEKTRGSGFGYWNALYHIVHETESKSCSVCDVHVFQAATETDAATLEHLLRDFLAEARVRTVSYSESQARRAIASGSDLDADAPPGDIMSPVVARVTESLGGDAGLWLSEYQGKPVYSNGHFLAIADQVPPGVARAITTRVYDHRSPKDMSAVIPKAPHKKASVVTDVTRTPDHDGNATTVSLAAGGVCVVANALYFDYLRELYPASDVMITSANKPIIFWEEKRPVAILIPIGS